MRQIATSARIRAFLTHLGRATDHPTKAYLTGGSTAVLVGWRDSTIDIDLKLVPETSSVLRAIPRLKEQCQINVELASPDLFIPVPPGWEDRSPTALVAGLLSVHHFDLTAQAMAKIERGHTRDLADVAAMLERKLVTREGIAAFLDAVEPELYRFPAVDPPSLRQAVQDVLES